MKRYEKMLYNIEKLNSWGVVVIGNSAQLRELETPRGSRIQVRMIEGNEATDHDSFMKSLWKPLELPYYFGENWSAFEDAIQDMEWLQADSYIFTIIDADQILVADKKDFETFLQLSKDVHLTWKNPNSDGFISSWTTEPKEMFFLFQVSPSKKQEMLSRFKQLNVELPVVELGSLIG